MSSFLAANVFDIAEKAAGLFVTAVGVLAAIISFIRWRNRPRFVCGVLPLENELARSEFSPGRLGRQSLTQAFRFNERYFAKRLRRPDVAELPQAFRERLRSDLSSRRLTVGADGMVSLPVYLANYGGRTAEDLTCSVILTAPASDVRVCDAEAESLDYRVFVLDQSALSDHAKERSAPDGVVNAYSRALAYVPLGDGVWLSGDLNANTFEVVCLTLRIEPSEIWFELLFTINCSDGFVRASLFVQALHAERNS